MNIYKRFIRAIEWLGASIVAASAVIYFAQILFRFVLNAPITWSDELCGHLVVMIAYVGAILALDGQNHINVDILLNSLSRPRRKIVETVSGLLVIGFCGIVAYYGSIVTLNSTTVPASTYPIPLAIPYGVIPASFAVMGFVAILQLIRKLRNVPEEKAREVH